jgi:hypothetical protein
MSRRRWQTLSATLAVFEECRTLKTRSTYKNGSTLLGSFSNLPGPSYFDMAVGGAHAITKLVLSDGPLGDCCFETDNCSAIRINTAPAPIVSAGLLE